MTKEVKLDEKTKTNTEDKDLLKEFKKEVLSGSRRNLGSIIFGVISILLVFGFLGVGSYQIFFKPDKVEVNNSEAIEKIENRPEENQVQNNQTPQTPVVQQPVTPQPTYIDYSVQEGDTWSSIANSHNMTSAELMKYNNATSEMLQIGQKIKIPK